jgi:peptidoglycan/xylan/chitin deacetylase (PgdA/CDA1 family)
MIRGWIKNGAAQVLSRTGMHRKLGRWAGAGTPPVVVGYHRVVEDFAASAAWSIPSMLVSTRMLERQLDWIGRRYRFVSLDDMQAVENGSQHRNCAAVTFDDGYRDFYDHAFPLLKRKGIPAAVFVVTSLLGTDEVQDHDRLYLLLSKKFGERPFRAAAYSEFLQSAAIWLPGPIPRTAYQATRALLEGLSQESLHRLIAALMAQSDVSETEFRQFVSMTWDMTDRVRRAGITIGSHTRSHVLMTNEGLSRLTEEAAGSKAEIESRLGGRTEHFAYPSGCFDDEAVAAVASAGYRFAYTVCRHRNSMYPQLTIPRVLLWERSSLDSAGEFAGAVLDCQVHGAFELVSGCRSHHGKRRRRENAG